MPDKYHSTTAEHPLLKVVAQIILALLGILLVGAIVFYKERELFSDAPHILFSIINDHGLQITEHRYGSFITQLVPYIGAWLHLPLRALMILYSASFYLFYIVIALLLIYKYRNYRLAILFGLYQVLFVSDTYFWPNNELHQGIAWLFLALAINFNGGEKRALFPGMLLFALSFFLAIWTHPLIMMAAVYLWVFLLLDKTSWPFAKKRSFIYSAILLLLCYAKFHQGLHDWYDGGKIETVTQFQPKRLLSVFTSPQSGFFIKGCLTNYWIVVLLFIAGIISMIKERKYLLAVWAVLFAVFYYLLICITFWNNDISRFYIESEYMPLAIICAAPAVYFTLPKLNKNIAILAITLICFTRLAYIYKASHLFTNRITIMKRMEDKMSEKNLMKVIITEPSPGVDNALLMNWGAPVESIMLSRLKREKPQRTFIFLDTAQIRRYSAAAASRDTLLGCFEKRAASNVNGDYFQIDTSSTYQVITYDSLMK